MFTVTPLPAKRRVHVEFFGNYDHDPDAFHAALKHAVAEVQAKDRAFDILCDFTRASVMPQDHAASGEAAIAWCSANGLRKSANVIASVTQRMQVRRVAAGNPSMGFFADTAEAEEWLAA